MSAPAPADIPSLLGSRICHDLISPLGAIGNGVELLSMAGLSDGPEVALIAESVANANARIRFFRIAFGAADDASRLGVAEIRDTLDDVTRAGRLTIDWRADGDPLRAEAKLVFLLIQCLESALAWGGSIMVDHRHDRWTVRGKAGRLRIEPDLWELVLTPAGAEALSSSNVQFALVGSMARRLGRSVQTKLSETAITISF